MVESFIIWIIVGAIAGWLAGMVVKGGGFGLIGDIVVGIVGAVIAGWLLPYLGIALGSGFVAAVIDAFIGSAKPGERKDRAERRAAALATADDQADRTDVGARLSDRSRRILSTRPFSDRPAGPADRQ
jgi:uncharacterized membrane protein YeaQ/YmgE (transglycosylase-associated protein family)